MKRVIVESPFAGDRATNIAYLDQCLLDCRRRNEAPFASHGFYTHWLDDNVPEERAYGIAAGLAWGRDADLVAVYCDLGFSTGMRLGIAAALERYTPIVLRTLNDTKRPCDRQACEAIFGDMVYDFYERETGKREMFASDFYHDYSDTPVDTDPRVIAVAGTLPF